MATKLTEAEAQARFPGFIVKDGEFETDGTNLYRVNSNGKAISLARWSFNKDVGEWFFIKKKVGNSAITESDRYEKRWVRYHNGGGPRIALGLCGGMLAVIAVPCAVGMVEAPWLVLQVLIAVPLIACVGTAVFCFRVLKTNNEETIVGPEPLALKRDDFGPSSATASADHPATDDLAYKPTV